MNESKATRYQRLRRRAHAAGIASAALMLGLIAFTPVSRSLSVWAHAFAEGLSGPVGAAVALVLFVVLVVALWEFASLPAMIYLALRVDRLYGQPVPSIEEVLGAQAQATVVALPAALAAGAIVIVAADLVGAWWWLVAGLVLALLLAGALRMAPVLLATVADVRPLAREELRFRLAELSHRARVPIAGIDEWMVGGSQATPALVTGAGRTRRVLLSSDVARNWSTDEIAVVVAHELAHHAYGDLWRTLALNVLVLCGALFAADVVVRGTVASLALEGPGDLAALPLIALVASAVWMATAPLRHAQSRRHERRADVFALALTGGAVAFGAAIKRLGLRLLAEERPSLLTRWLYHRHPSVAERLALAEEYARVQGSGFGVRGSGFGIQRSDDREPGTLNP